VWDVLYLIVLFGVGVTVAGRRMSLLLCK